MNSTHGPAATLDEKKTNAPRMKHDVKEVAQVFAFAHELLATPRDTSTTAAATTDAVIEAAWNADKLAMQHEPRTVREAFWAGALLTSAQAVPPVASMDAMLDELHGQLYTAQRTSGDAQAKAIGSARITLSHYRNSLASAQAVPQVAPTDTEIIAACAENDMFLRHHQPGESDRIPEGGWFESMSVSDIQKILECLDHARAALKGNGS